MSIYIKNLEMPENGSCLQIVIDDDGKVYPSVEKCIQKMDSMAKAISVPPHGDLKDVDALEDNNITYYAIPALTNVTDATIEEAELVVRLKDIDTAPIIIPADPVEEK